MHSLELPGVLDNMLCQAGFRDYTIRPIMFHYRPPSFDDYWNVAEQSDILKMQYDVLPENQHGIIRNEIAALASAFVGESGLVIPHELLLAAGVK